MKRVARALLAAVLAFPLLAEAQTYTYVDLGVAPYTDTFGQSAYSDTQVGYGLVGGQPQALLWQSTASSATALPTTIPQPVGPSSANMIVIGDSITAGVDGFPQNAAQGYPATMQSSGMGQNGALVYNLGLPGETTGEMAWQYDSPLGATPVTTTVTTISGSPSATIGDATDVTTGMSIGAMGIPPNTTITAISGTAITLSSNATATENSVTCSIATPVQDVAAGSSYYPGGAANGWSNFTNTAHQLSYAISGRPTYCFILAGTNDITATGPNMFTATSTAGSPNITITDGDYSSFANGDVVNGDNLPSNPPPYIVSGGGTSNLVLSANALGTGSFSVEQWTSATPLTTLETNYANLVAEAHADGDAPANGGGVIAMTLLPRGNSTQFLSSVNNVFLTEFNAWLKTGASGADYVFDTNSCLPPFGPATSSAYYFEDQLHLSAEGTAVVGNYINQQFFAQVDTAANNYQSAKALGIDSVFVAGYGVSPQSQTVALLWNGLTQTPVNLNPSFASSSVATCLGANLSPFAVAGSATVAGTGQQVAVCWTGTAASAVNLNPTGATSSQVLATAGDYYQAGSAVFSGITKAEIWNGTAASAVTLHPSGALRSEALGVTTYLNETTYKQVDIGDYTTSAGAVHACLWQGTASSMVDLHPSSGYTSTTAVAVNATTFSTTYQGTAVGFGTTTGGTTVVLLWNNTSNAAINLSTYLPNGTTSSRATGIDPADGSIVGVATINGSNHAFVLRPSSAPTFQSPAQSLSTIIGLPYTYNVVAKGFPNPTYALTGYLPPGLTMSPTTGVISGTPTLTGTFIGTITATNSAGSVSQRATITVVAAPADFQMSVVGSLNPANGTGRHQSMVLGSDGNFYGTCTTGGVLTAGTVFEMTPAGVETTVHDFGDGSVSYDGAQPEGLSFGSDGTLYGTTFAGGSAGNGTVFNINQGTATILHNFGSASQDGANPACPIIQATDGNFYGVTTGGGSQAQGTMFSITPSGTTTILTSFGGIYSADGVSPDTSLLQWFIPAPAPPGLSGGFYGATPNGGVENRGIVFGAGTTGADGLVITCDATIPPILGYRMHGPLREGTDGNVYGIASAGGTSSFTGYQTSDPVGNGLGGIGTIYKITTLGTPTQTDLHNFGDGTVGNDGSNTTEQNAPLVQGADGNFYGVTPAGGSANQGCLFQITSSGSMLVLHSFGDGTLANDGSDPGPVFFLGPDGYTFYGITEKGGANGDGAIYKFNIGMAPNFTSTVANEPGYVGIPFSYTVSATGYPTPTHSLKSGSLPPGLTLASNGMISGTPTTMGNYVAHISASNGVGTSPTTGIIIDITNIPSITNGPPTTTIPIGIPYTFTYTSTGTPAPTFTVSNGSLPTGLTLSSSGVISGTPTTAGTFTGTVDAGNGNPPDATQNFSIQVINSYAAWAGVQGLTGASAAQTAVLEPDGLNNLFKYALGLNPATNYNPGAAGLPVVQMQNIAGTNYLTLTFTGVAIDVTYTVQAANDPAGPWSTIATYNGYPPPGTVTVQDSQPVGASPARFMQLQITGP